VAAYGEFCMAAVTAKVSSQRSGSVASYIWFDKTGNERGLGDSLDMVSVVNDFQLYLLTIGTNGLIRYSFFHGGVC
jgi:hypothetical protein